MEAKLSLPELVQNAINNNSESLRERDDRRLIWKEQTKTKICKTIDVIIKTFNLNLECLIEDRYRPNYDSIYISFQEDKKTKDDKTFYYLNKIDPVFYSNEQHGYFGYRQIYNGKINVVTKSPYIKHLILEEDEEVLATVEPNEITEYLISEHFILFLNKKALWERKSIKHNYKHHLLFTYENEVNLFKYDSDENEQL